VKVSGCHTIPIPPGQAYAALQDPAILAKCMPGCESLDRIDGDRYAMRMKMVLASMTGLFQGTVSIADAVPPSSFRLVVEGAGKVGFMKGDGVLTLVAVESGTEVHYDGVVEIGGLLANVGQRLLDTTSRMLINRFFKNLANTPAVTGFRAGQAQ